MSTAALVFILASAMVHAVWNTWLKRQSSPHLATIGVAVWCCVTAVGYALLTLPGRPFPTPASWHWSLLAGCFEAGYFYTLGLALEKAPLPVVYTLSRGTAVVFVWPLSIWLNHEGVTWQSASGAALVAAGLLLSGYPQRGSTGSRAGVLAALAAALFISLNHVSYKQAIVAEGNQAAINALSMMVATAFNMVRATVLKDETRTRSLLTAAHEAGLLTSWPIIGIGTLCTLSFIFALAAMGSTGAGAVLTLRNLSIPFALLLAWRFGQPPDRRQTVGGMLVALGGMIFSFR